jgi:hypothetical protein
MYCDNGLADYVHVVDARKCLKYTTAARLLTWTLQAYNQPLLEMYRNVYIIHSSTAFLKLYAVCLKFSLFVYMLPEIPEIRLS